MMMTYRQLILSAYMLISIDSVGQTPMRQLIGTVHNTTGDPLSGASVFLTDVRGKAMIAYAITDQQGKFHLKFNPNPDSMLLRIDHLQVEPFRCLLDPSTFHDTISTMIWVLNERVNDMQEIKFKVSPLSYKQGWDTIEFRAKSYKTVETRKVEDLFRNIQGFQLTEDGKVYFQGKEVDRILFDGEDLTDRNYRLLSKNLNADLVDRVQVIDNYHPDRLVQSIDRSGRIAINLTIDSSFKFRVSGTVSLSSSLNRGLFDASLVFPGRTFKALSFLNFNDVGSATGTQLSEDRLGDSEGEGSLSSVVTSNLLEMTSIPPPPLEATYARDNEDGSVMQVLSAKNSRGQSFRWMAGVGQSRLKRNSDLESTLIRINGKQWLMQQSETFASNASQALLSFRYLHDAGGSRRGQMKITVSGTGNAQVFENTTTGDLMDSLNENAKLLGMQTRLEGSETFRLGDRSLVRFSYQADAGRSRQDQDFETQRFLSNHLSLTPYTRFEQDFNRSVMSGRSDLIYHFNNDKSHWSTGIRLNIDHERQHLRLHGTNNTAVPFQGINNNSRNINTSRSMLYASWQININRKLLLGSGLEIGPSGFITSDGIGLDSKDRFLHRATMSLDYKASMMTALGMKIFRYKTLPMTDWFHVGPFFNADGHMRTPSSLVKPEFLNGFIMSASRMNLARSFTAMLYLSITHQSNTYMAIADRSPGVFNTTYAPFDAQRGLMISGNLSKHFPNLFLKIMTEGSLQSYEGETSLDGEMVRQSNGRMSLQQRLISAIPFPINFELTYTATRISNRIITKTANQIGASQWQHIGMTRLKYRFAEKGNMTMLYACRVLREGNVFQTIDLYARWKASKSFSFSLTGHNLTDARMLTIRSLSLNATTDQRVSLVGRYILLGLEWSF